MRYLSKNHSAANAMLVVLIAANIPTVACAQGVAEQAEFSPAPTLSRSELEDKIRGGWAGQMIGVSYGSASEFHYQGRINEGPLPWKPELVSEAMGQDDLYVEMSFVDVLDKSGPDASAEQFGQALKFSHFGLCHGNAGARRLLDAGFAAPLSGDPRLNSHAADIDFQMESDFIGLSTPGMPLEAICNAGGARRGACHGYIFSHAGDQRAFLIAFHRVLVRE